MDDSREFDLDRMMERIRLKVRDSRQPAQAGGAPASGPAKDQQSEHDLAELHHAYDLSHVSLDPGRRVLGRTMLTAAKAVRAVLSPIIRRQSEYNAANTRLITIVKKQLDRLVPEVAELRAAAEQAATRSAEELSAHTRALTRRFDSAYAADIAMHAQALSDLSHRMAALERLQADRDALLARIETLERRQEDPRREIDGYGLESSSRQQGEHGQRLREHGQRLEEQEQHLRGQEQLLREQEQSLREQEQSLREQEQSLREHRQWMQDRDELLAKRERRVESIDARYSELAAALAAARAAHSEQEASSRSHYEEFKLLRERVLRAERRLRGLVNGHGDGSAVPAQVENPAAAQGVGAIDYVGFEERLRDSRMVKDRQRVYLDYFKDKAPVIDVGCGKGEFLELMREAGVAAKGLDLDLDMILLCRDKGLDVEQRDALGYLAAQPDCSVGAIFSAQVIEHLTSAQLNALITVGWRKLRSGGIMLLETLNPESLFVHYKWFWMDPSHVRLVHPQTLQFLLESAGFTELSCHLASPPADVLAIPPLQGGVNGAVDDFNRATDYLNKLIYGDQEYFVVARK